MTLQDLRLMVERGARQDAKLQRISQDLTNEELFIADRFANRPFYCGSTIEKNPRKKCFTHLVDLMEKNGRLHGWYDYELSLLNDLENGVKYQAIKKARGIGISTLFIRYMAFLACCRNEEYRNKRFAIVVGPRENLAVDLVNRLKQLVARFGIVQETERTICQMLGVTIEAFPSARVSTLRSFDNVKFVYVDEASFFGSQAQDAEVRAAVEGYIAKTNPFIVLVSTPSVPGTMFEQIMEESTATCLYKRYHLPYTVALGKLYTQQEIDAAKSSPHFQREYNLQYSYGLGNLVLESNLKQCIIDYKEPTWEELANGGVITCGVDQGFSTSKLGIVVTAILPSVRLNDTSINRPTDTSESNLGVGEKVYVLEASEFEKLSFEVSVQLVANILRKYGHSVNSRNVIALCDAARPEWLEALRNEVEAGQSINVVDYAKQHKIKLDQLTSVIPVGFGHGQGQEMLSHLQSLISDHNLAIAPRFSELLLQLRTCKVKATGMIDKSSASFDLIDALQLSCWNHTLAGPQQL